MRVDAWPVRHVVARVPGVGRVIVVGSINVDFTVHAPSLPGPGQTVVGGTFARRGGGKGANQAVAAARAGAEVILIGAVGADDLGAAALVELSNEGIDTSRCHQFANASTGIALIVVDRKGDNQIAVASGANRAFSVRDFHAAIAALSLEKGDVIVTGFELEDDVVMAAISWAVSRGARALLNPAPARVFDPAMLGARPILTPNQHEAAGLTGTTDPEQAARALQDRTSAPVIVTLGPNGALLMELHGAMTMIPALPVDAIDATGAGDALNGIFAAELAAGTPIELAVRRAVIGASLSTTKPGARAGLPTRQEIDRALESRIEG